MKSFMQAGQRGFMLQQMVKILLRHQCFETDRRQMAVTQIMELLPTVLLTEATADTRLTIHTTLTEDLAEAEKVSCSRAEAEAIQAAGHGVHGQVQVLPAVAAPLTQAPTNPIRLEQI